jgi:hypothetical protein
VAIATNENVAMGLKCRTRTCCLPGPTIVSLVVGFSYAHHLLPMRSMSCRSILVDFVLSSWSSLPSILRSKSLCCGSRISWVPNCALLRSVNSIPWLWCCVVGIAAWEDEAAIESYGIKDQRRVQTTRTALCRSVHLWW